MVTVLHRNGDIPNPVPQALLDSEFGLAVGERIATEVKDPKELLVRIVGAVKKGQPVYVDANGCASTAINGGSIVGIALETNMLEEEKLVECVLKV